MARHSFIQISKLPNIKGRISYITSHTRQENLYATYRTAEIKADNVARQDWNRMADMALISGIDETKILEIKQAEIHDKISNSICKSGWPPNLFRSIVSKAKGFLQNLIR